MKMRNETGRLAASCLNLPSFDALTIPAASFSGFHYA
jgi:hypothetical protein